MKETIKKIPGIKSELKDALASIDEKDYLISLKESEIESLNEQIKKKQLEIEGLNKDIISRQLKENNLTEENKAQRNKYDQLQKLMEIDTQDQFVQTDHIEYQLPNDQKKISE